MHKHVLLIRKFNLKTGALGQPNGVSKLGFPTGWDSATFRDTGTEVPSLSRDKGTTGQSKNLAKGRDRPG